MHRFAVAAACSAAAASAQSAPLYTTCQWSAMGAQYDLSPMTITAPGGSYQVLDEHDNTKTYYFNFCTEVSRPIVPKDPCAQASGNRPANLPSALAWQVDSPNAQGGDYFCYMSGGAASQGWNFSLIDPIRPHKGMRMTYTTGENMWCPFAYSPVTQSYIQSNRSFTVELPCSPVAVQTAYGNANVFETDGSCKYRMILPSIAGCPQQCITNLGTNGQPAQICNGRGICGYDSDNKYTKCFCYSGYKGNGCTEAVVAPAGLSVESGLLIAAFIVLAGVVGMTAFMFVKLRKLQIDPAAYSELEGRFNELGMVA